MCSARCAKRHPRLQKHSITNGAIRIDPGDLTYLSRRAAAWDGGAERMQNCGVQCSDEYIIRDLINQGACIDALAGRAVDYSKSEPVFGGI